MKSFFVVCTLRRKQMTLNEVQEKIRPFFQELENLGGLKTFDVDDWRTVGTAAYEFATLHLTDEERGLLSELASLVLLSPVRIHHMAEWDNDVEWKY
jgi:hypothetical protein